MHVCIHFDSAEIIEYIYLRISCFQIYESQSLRHRLKCLLSILVLLIIAFYTVLNGEWNESVIPFTTPFCCFKVFGTILKELSNYILDQYPWNFFRHSSISSLVFYPSGNHLIHASFQWKKMYGYQFFLIFLLLPHRNRISLAFES